MAIAMIKLGVMAIFAYRSSVFLNSIGNIVYIVVLYFLWSSIYGSNDVSLNGMTFRQTFIYLALAATIFNVFKTWTEWEMSERIISGDILIYLAKPIDFQLYMLFYSLSFTLFNVACIGIPVSAAIMVFLPEFFTNYYRVFFIVVVFALAYLISFHIDYLIGLASFFTESLWGISLTKEAVVLTFSGALVPLAFFPYWLRAIGEYLPFQYIYHAPLTLLVSEEFDVYAYLKIVRIQVIWLIVFFLLCRLCYTVAVRRLSTNGG